MKKTIDVYASCFHPKVQMIIDIPNNRDIEEYIDEFFDNILNEDIKYNIEWEFVN
jgi:hypothetical protein